MAQSDSQQVLFPAEGPAIASRSHVLHAAQFSQLSGCWGMRHGGASPICAGAWGCCSGLRSRAGVSPRSGASRIPFLVGRVCLLHRSAVKCGLGRASASGRLHFCFPLSRPAQGLWRQLCLSLEESELGNGCLYGEFGEGRLCSRGDELPGLLNLVPVSKYFQHVSSEVGPGPATGEAKRGHGAGTWEAFLQVERIFWWRRKIQRSVSSA